MSTIVRHEDGAIIFAKGASEIMLGLCTKRMGPDGVEDLDEDMKAKIESNVINRYAGEALRTMTLAYKIISEDEIEQALAADADEEGVTDGQKFCETDLTYIAVVGIQDPLRPGVKQAVLDARTAGIHVRMVTGDNIETAQAIAKEASILEAGYR